MVLDEEEPTYHHCGQKFSVQTGDHGPFLMIDKLVMSECPKCKERRIRTSFMNGRSGFYTEDEWYEIEKNPFYRFLCGLGEL